MNCVLGGFDPSMPVELETISKIWLHPFFFMLEYQKISYFEKLLWFKVNRNFVVEERQHIS